ncbi:Glycosyltransferase, GT2 family [Ekhidna lutea]|uniref:Glycosyltransferase, GT2 family n=1 Tax=Ekhidna lutea TaxID=447679 RepID=A0A239FSN4_EKHLU|nr:glycosyltransferase family 2 protein [Ekhidna lutea]SNS59242.1 Glycosyltransferase, GT2 family [Ekhidna lutea]
MKQKIAIGLGTKDRPEMLKRSLRSLVDLITPEGTELLLLVCENGNSSDALGIVENIKTRLNLNVIFFYEKKAGIVFMRNAILEKALSEQASYLAFFDDDEEVTPHWLLNLNKARVDYNAEVVQGHLIQNFEVEVDSLVQDYFPGSFDNQTGEYLEVAYTNNVLIDLEPIKRHNLRFNAKFNLTGGSDSLFFIELRRIGAKVVFCKEAVVAETIPASRSNIDWLLQRSYRNGYTKFMIESELRGTWRSFLFGLGFVYNVVKTSLFSPFTRNRKLNEKEFLRLKKINRAKGIIHAMIGIPFSEYETTHGN